VAKNNHAISKVIILILRAYQYCISPLLGNHCRFYPNCSTYAMDALRMHGFLSASLLIVKRLLRCHPWHQGGIDPVPEKNTLC
jgi:uncharacterized protein